MTHRLHTAVPVEVVYAIERYAVHSTWFSSFPCNTRAAAAAAAAAAAHDMMTAAGIIYTAAFHESRKRHNFPEYLQRSLLLPPDAVDENSTLLHTLGHLQQETAWETQSLPPEASSKKTNFLLFFYAPLLKNRPGSGSCSYSLKRNCGTNAKQTKMRTPVCSL